MEPHENGKRIKITQNEKANKDLGSLAGTLAIFYYSKSEMQTKGGISVNIYMALPIFQERLKHFV